MKYTFSIHFVVILSIGYALCKFVNKTKQKQRRNSIIDDNAELTQLSGFEQIPSDTSPENVTAIKYITLPVDHFDARNKETWTGRFAENNNLFQPNSPVFIYVGGNERMKEHISKGLLYDLAKVTNGSIFATEHRYYGKSLKTQDFKYLYSSQAIEDLKLLVDRIKSVEGYENSKVILLGEKYGASLAVWTKKKYPEIIHAVIANSALLNAEADAFKVVHRLVEHYKKHVCESDIIQIKRIVDKYIEYIDTKNYDALKKSAHICQDVNMTTSLNQQLFFQSELTLFLEKAQDSNEMLSYSQYFIAMHPISSKSKRKTIKDYIDKRKTMNNYNKTVHCFLYDFNTLIATLSADPLRNDVTKNYYQMCYEFGHFITTKNFPKPYSRLVPLTFYSELCASLFRNHNKEHSMADIKLTNKQYGGFYPNITNVIYVVGEFDPWKYQGLPSCTANSDTILRLTMLGEPCCNLFDPYGDADSSELQATRKIIKTAILLWLEQ